jgi:DNA-binding NarL/FixJ family response regulator
MLWTRNDSEMTGLDVLKEIRKKDTETSVIVLSGVDEKEVIDEYYQHGATKYITKNSFFIDSLIDIIKTEFAQNSSV